MSNEMRFRMIWKKSDVFFYKLLYKIPIKIMCVILESKYEQGFV